MALADLLHVLEGDADAEIRAVAAEGDAEAARIDAGAALASHERVAAVAADVEQARAAADDVELAAATREARAGVLVARAALLERVREVARAELPARVSRDAGLARALIASALACIGDEAGTMRCAPALADAARAAVPAAIRVEVDPAVATGAIVELASGTRIDATLAALLDRAWPELACIALAAERAR